MTSDNGTHPDSSPEPDTDGTERDETATQRADRNWDELLQELRVTQTGIQILSGFLLTLPFQQRFTALSEPLRILFLVAVALATTSTGLVVAPVPRTGSCFADTARLNSSSSPTGSPKRGWSASA